MITSDHGTKLFEHGRIDHGFTLYEELLHVPLVIKLPKGSASGRVADRISSIDLLPTILELMAVDPPVSFRRQMRGTSLVPAMKGEPAARDLFAETDYREYTFKRSIVAPDGWKLIVTLETGTRELYDLARDPSETTDLARDEPLRAHGLQRRLFARFKAIGHDLEARSWRRGLNPVYQSQGR